MSSASAPMDASKLSRTTINDLPTEVKTRIAEFCDEQDERASKWIERTGVLLGSRRADIRAKLQSVFDETKTRHRSSVGGLFCVSKEWSQITASFRFKHLSTQRINDTVFLYAVGPLRSHHFSSLHLASVPGGNDPGVAGLLANIALSNIQEVTIHGAWYTAVVGSLYSTANRFPAALHARILGGTERLTLSGVDAYVIQHIVAQAPLLQKLHLSLHPTEPNSAQPRLARILAACPRLQDFSLEYDCEVAFDFAKALDAKGDVRDKWPALRFLSYRGLTTHTFLAFACHFSSTLEHLTIDALDIEDGDMGPRFADERFPRLVLLKLAGSDDSSTPLLESIRPHHTPNLRSITYEELEQISGPEPYAAVFDKINQFRLGLSSPSKNDFTLHIHFVRDFWQPEDRDYLVTHAKSLGLRLCLSCSSEPSFGWPKQWGLACDEESDSPTARQLRQDVERTLQFLSDERDRAARSDNAGEWAKLADLLKNAEFERSIMAL